MKFMFIGLSFFFCFVLLVGCVAETMAAPNGPLPLMMVLDRILTGICIFCCFLALLKIWPAVILAWVVIVLRLLFNWEHLPVGYLMQGVVEYAVAVALCLSVIPRLDKTESAGSQ